MPEVSATALVRAINDTATDGSRKTDTSENGRDETNWFVAPARQLLGSDAGYALHILTDAPESSCYRWMRGDAPLPLYRFRQLVHRPEGETWMRVLMDGCEQPWWREHQTALDLATRFKIEPR